MRELLRFYFKAIIWLIRWGIVVWFVLLPCMMLFGILKPWPEAREALRAEGVTGVPLFFGSGSSWYGSEGGTWEKSQQSSYIVVPDSFRHMEIFTYTVTETDVSLPVAQVQRFAVLPLVIILYIGAGAHTFFVFRRLARRRRARLIQEG